MNTAAKLLLVAAAELRLLARRQPVECDLRLGALGPGLRFAPARAPLGSRLFVFRRRGARGICAKSVSTGALSRVGGVGYTYRDA